MGNQESNSMIKVNELRIGNLVESEDGVCPIIEIDSENTFKRLNGEVIKGSIRIKINELGDTRSRWIYKIRPIQITEEWLLNLGFGKRFPEYFYVTIEATEPENKEFRQFALSLENGNFMSNMRKGLAVKYIHQLQNLYYAITGKELELKGGSLV